MNVLLVFVAIWVYPKDVSGVDTHHKKRKVQRTE